MATPAVLQQAGSGGGAVTLSSTASGSSIVVTFCGLGTATPVTGVTDNKGNVYSQAVGAQGTGTSSFRWSDIWYFIGSAAGITTVTPSYSGPISENLNVYEVTNLASLDATTVNNITTGATSQVSNPITTTAANDFIIQSNSAGINGALTGVNTPYTFYSGVGGLPNSAYHVPSTTVTNETATFNSSSADEYAIGTAAFKASSGFNPAWAVNSNIAFSGSPH